MRQDGIELSLEIYVPERGRLVRGLDARAANAANAATAVRSAEGSPSSAPLGLTTNACFTFFFDEVILSTLHVQNYLLWWAIEATRFPLGCSSTYLVSTRHRARAEQGWELNIIYEP
jgi:hypothetical protein